MNSKKKIEMLFLDLIKDIIYQVYCFKRNRYQIKMSANNNRSRASASNSSELKKKFCKVCQDAGKSEKEYTSHYVRSAPGPNGVVVCPTLLSQECRYCYGRGHTVKFCTVLEKNKKAEAFATSSSNQKKVVAKEKPVAKLINAFDALYASDEEEEKELPKVSNNTNIVEKFPVLGTTTVKKEPVKANAFSYAAALATEVKPKPVAPIAVPVIKATPVKKWKSWADCDSSSDEDEDEEEQVQKPVVYEDNSAW